MASSNEDNDDEYVPEESEGPSSDDDAFSMLSIDEIFRAVKKSGDFTVACQTQKKSTATKVRNLEPKSTSHSRIQNEVDNETDQEDTNKTPSPPDEPVIDVEKTDVGNETNQDDTNPHDSKTPSPPDEPVIVEETFSVELAVKQINEEISQILNGTVQDDTDVDDNSEKVVDNGVFIDLVEVGTVQDDEIILQSNNCCDFEVDVNSEHDNNRLLMDFVVDMTNGTEVIPSSSCDNENDLNTSRQFCDNEVPILTNEATGETAASIPRSSIDENDVILFEDDVTGGTSESLKKRKSIPNSNQWAKEVAKTKRLRGEAYVGCRRLDLTTANAVVRDANKHARKIGPKCTSTACAKWKNRLCNTITESERTIIFNEFWQKMDWETKRLYVCSSVEVKPTAQHTSKKPVSRRSLTPLYHLKVNGEKIPVCREMFLNTLGVKKKMVQNWVNKFRTCGPSSATSPTQSASDTSPTDEENEPENGKSHGGTPLPVSDSVMKNRESQGAKNSLAGPSSGVVQTANSQAFLHEWFQKLPKLPSHYNRKSSSKLYLQTDIKSWSQLFELYQHDCEQKKLKPVSRFTFDKARRLQDIALHKPKKDRCDLCYNHENGIAVSTKIYEKHRDLKDRAQKEKELDKVASINGDCYTLCCDMMAVQTMPHIRASSAYFKLKLTMHNFTIYNLANHEAMNYWFYESESTLSASTFASFLIDYISELLKGSVKTVIVFSDGCGYQNRNAVLANALLHLSVEKQITIIQKFLVKGHTYMECDSVHSTVEHGFKNSDVYLPHNYVQMTKTARKKPMPYGATLVDHTYFKDFGQESMMAYPSIRPGKRAGDPVVNDIRMLQYNPDGRISFKIDFSDDLQDLPCRPKPVARLISDFPPLLEDRPKIPKDKYNDLQWLKTMLPADAHDFYDNLPCETESRRENKRQLKKKTAGGKKLL